ncbi:MAG: peptide chain release factor N(5)-glutamine methyltransferase [Prolixibacteraceae bacterium]
MKITLSYIRKTLISCYSQQEIEAFISIIFKHIYNYSKNDLILNAYSTLPEKDCLRIAEIVENLMSHHPIQYILGETEFYDLTFKVNSDVLIPRNETEELVHLILKNYANRNLKILDIGTGSGCIPISLKKNRPDFEVFSCDISKKALALARKNASLNNVVVQFHYFDVLSNEAFFVTGFDIIVSNPPYVTEKEKKLMEANVLDHEPHLALFVPDQDPLLFYKAISKRAASLLTPDGEIYFEINEAYGQEVVQLLQNSGLRATVIKDINGKDRIVVGSRK